MKKLITICALVSIIFIAAPQTNAATEFAFECVNQTYNPTNEYPYQFDYDLIITTFDPIDVYANDYHMEWPVKYGGYLIITPPENWTIAEVELYGIGYETNDNDAFYSQAGTFHGWKIEGKVPQLVDGYARLTKDGQTIAETPCMLPDIPEPVTLTLLTLGGLALIRRRH